LYVYTEIKPAGFPIRVHMKQLRVLFLFILGFCPGFTGMVKAQEQLFPDSLAARLKINPADTGLMMELCVFIDKNIYNDPNRMMDAAGSLLAHASEIKYYRVIPRLLMYQGIVYDLNGKYDSAIFMYDSALAIAGKHKLLLVSGDIYNNYSIVYSIMGQLEKAVEYALQALEIYEQLGDSANMAKVFNNLGSRYSEMGMNDRAISFYQMAIAINEKQNNLSRLVKNYGNTGTVYSAIGQNEKALEYYTRAYMIQKDLDNKLDMSITLSNMAITYRYLGRYDMALSFAGQSYTLACETNDEIGKLFYFLTSADIYKDQGSYVKATEHYQRAESMADSIGAKQNLMEIYRGLAEVYAARKDYRNAYVYNEKYNNKRISLLDQEKSKALDRIEQFEKDKSRIEIELLTKESEIQELRIKRQKILRNSFAGAGMMLLLLAVLIWHRYRYVRRTKNKLAEKNLIIHNEKEKADQLLLNILPAETANELKNNGFSKARSFDMVSVMFTDFKGFTRMAEIMEPDELVAEIDQCFKAFDNIISNYPIEKIKTIGDAYMCAGGLPVANMTNPVDVVNAALEINAFMEGLKAGKIRNNQPYFEIRIGIHTGPVIAGIVGFKKFQYDIWGDTVNIASRMESSGEVGEVNISGTTFELVGDRFNCIHRGKVEAKNKGAIDMYFVK